MEKSVFTSEYRILCKLLREKRQAAKLTQIDLAKRLKETQSYVSKVERGDRRLDLVQLKQFCKVLDVSFVQFVQEFDSLTSRPKR
jgi:transcriptional regulator with XRE-family HTH domain